MILTRIAALAAVLFALTVSAQARPHKAHRSQAIITCNQQGCSDRGFKNSPGHQGATKSNKRMGKARIETAGGGEGVVGGRPAECNIRIRGRLIPYCGCGVSLKVFGKVIPELMLALNWKRKFPRTSPAAGMVAAKSGHVFYIVSVIDSSTVVAYDPNSGGGRTRIHERSLHGYTVVNPHGSVAMN